MQPRFTLSDFRSRFPDDAACLNELFRLRFGSLEACPRCGKPARFHRLRRDPAYSCQHCAHQVFPMKGTPFEKTTTPLSDWFYVLYLMTATRSGVAAKEVQRQLGVTYKTAWRMCHKIREMMGTPTGRKLSGHVEADETYVGKSAPGESGRQIRSGHGKAPVIAVAERGGEVRAEVIPDVGRSSVQPVIERHVERGSVVSTDKFKSYSQLTKVGYKHGTVDHSKAFVAGDHHVQAVEGFWSRLKLSIHGTHVWVSKKHLQKYVDEFAFRYNHRKEPDIMFDRALENLRPPAGGRR